MKNKASTICIILLLFCISLTNAQKKDFSGYWMLKHQQNIYGELYTNGVPRKIKIIQEPDKIKLEKTTADQNDQDRITNETLLFDNTPFEMLTPSKRKKSISMKWSNDEKSFTTVISLYNPNDNRKIDMKVTDTWSLDNPQKLLMIRKAENFENGEVWESKSEYQKQ